MSSREKGLYYRGLYKRLARQWAKMGFCPSIAKELALEELARCIKVRVV